MKHFYTLLLMMVATAVAGFASTNKYVIDVDHADRVTVKFNYGDPVSLVDGVNAFEFESMSESGVYVTVQNSSEDYSIVSVVDLNGTSASGYSNYYYFNFVESKEESHYYKITTKDLTADRIASLTVVVDAPEKLRLRFSGNYRTVSFTENETVVKFDPTTENPVGLEKINYTDTYYSVKVNGEEATPSYGNYSITVQDGDKLEVQMLPPDVDYEYTITEEEEGYIYDVKVDGVSVEDVHNFSAHAGSTVTLLGGQGSWIFEKMIIGGSTVTSFYSSGYTFTATASDNIEIYAHRPGTFAVSFDIDDPDNVIIYTGYDQSKAFSNLVAGKQEIMIDESTSTIYLTVKASSNGILKSVKKNGNELFTSGTQVSSITIAEGDEFVIQTEKIVREWNAVIYINGYEDTHYITFANQDTHSDIAPIKEGYTKFTCGAVDNPAGLGFAAKNSDATPVVYVNGEVLSPMYEGGTTYNLTLADNMVIKVFVNGEPNKHALSFDIDDKVEGLSLRRDHITAITDFSAASSAHAGTVYHLTLEDPAAHVVTLDGTALTFDEENTAEFTPEADAVLAVAKNETTGIGNVTVEGAADNTIYNLQGVRLQGDSKNLPAGIYIIGGKKVQVK